MGIPLVTVNYVAILVAAIASMVVGSLWYSPALFGKRWMQHMGFTKKDLAKAKQKSMGKIYVAAFITALVMAYVLSFFIKVLGAATAGGGMQIAFWIWLGFLATTQLGVVLWENKPLELYYLNTGHTLVSLLLMGAILAVM